MKDFLRKFRINYFYTTKELIELGLLISLVPMTILINMILGVIFYKLVG